jgi:prepilin-type processing-associated H-X9-DG protein
MGCAGSAPNSFYGWNAVSNGSNGPFAGVFCFVGVACDSCNGGCPPCDTTNGQTRFSIGFRDVLDGLSNTSAFSERVKGIGSNNRDFGFDTGNPSSSFVDAPGVANNGLVTGDAGPQAFYNSCRNYVAPRPFPTTSLDNQDASGARWDVGYAPDTRYVQIMPPNWAYQCGGTDDDAGRQAGYSATSRHAGGVNLLMCDGSVRFIKNSVSAQTWWSLGTRSNNEVIDASSY